MGGSRPAGAGEAHRWRDGAGRKLHRLPPHSVIAPTRRTRVVLATAHLDHDPTNNDTANLGRRTALERVAHLLCELSAHLVEVGLSDGSECEMPLTQTELASATGVSAVQVNRSLGELRSSGLIELQNRRLGIHEREGLTRLAMVESVSGIGSLA